MKKTDIFLLFLVFLCLPLLSLHAKKNKQSMPKITVVIVGDQFAHHYIKKLRPFLNYGLKEILDNGLVYKNAYVPHGIPETTPGHHALSVGTLPKDHGAVLNKWFDENGNKVLYEQVAYNSTDVTCEKTRTDCLSDQFIFSSRPHKQSHGAYIFSLKAHAALSCSGRLGKAIWLDHKTGHFTINPNQQGHKPEWLKNFDAKHNFEQLESFEWHSVYPRDSRAYQFPYIDNYVYVATSLRPIEMPSIKINKKEKNPFMPVIQSPLSSEILFNLAKTCIRQTLDKKHSKLLIWILLSNLDYVGHVYGPECLETIDLIYHIDKQLGTFLTFLNQRVGKDKFLVAFTADHGVAPIPELQNDKGFTLARRIRGDLLITQMNALIENTYHIKDIVQNFESSYFTINQSILNTLEPKRQESIITTLKDFLQKQPGMKKVWTYDELTHTTFHANDLEDFYKNQLFKGRIGDLICQPEPYCQLTTYPTGTTHATIYEYDTHVPLIIYGRSIEKKNINERVFTTQLPTTLAHILKIPAPSASHNNVLPGT